MKSDKNSLVAAGRRGVYTPYDITIGLKLLKIADTEAVVTGITSTVIV